MATPFQPSPLMAGRIDTCGGLATLGGPISPLGLCPFGHQGLFEDREWDQLYNRMRQGQPDFMRWPQQDPQRNRDGTNAYQYVRSGPVRRSDALGAASKTFDLSWEVWDSDTFSDDHVATLKWRVRIACDASGALNYDSERAWHDAHDLQGARVFTDIMASQAGPGFQSFEMVGHVSWEEANPWKVISYTAAGVATGASIGAGIGAGVGSAVPGPGTAAGATIGGVTGGVMLGVSGLFYGLSETDTVTATHQRREKFTCRCDGKGNWSPDQETLANNRAGAGDLYWRNGQLRWE